MIVKQRISIYVLVLPLDVFPDTCDTFVAPVPRRFKASLSLGGSSITSHSLVVNASRTQFCSEILGLRARK